jgi:3-keto-5-aminohexanoate cleavage enzyme
MNISVKKMKDEDLQDVIEILSRWNMAPVEPTSEVPEPERTSINIGNSFVALDGDRIVGVCSYNLPAPETGETASLAVYPEYQGKGIGYKLQLARFREMKGKGVKKVVTYADRPSTIAWYIKKFGYRITGKWKKKHAFGYCNDYYIILELDLENFEV